MKHARNDYQRFQDPWDAIPDDEPVILLRGQDKHFVMIMTIYAILVELDPECDPRIVQAVRNQVERAKAWPIKKAPDLPAEAAVL